MKKLFLIYLGVLFVLCASFLLVQHAYKGWKEYLHLTQRSSNVLVAYQDLDKHVTSTAALNPQLKPAANQQAARRAFEADKMATLESAGRLRSAVIDSLNVKIAKQLYTGIRRELGHLQNPSEDLHQHAQKHVAHYEAIKLLLRQGIARTRFIAEYRERELGRRFNWLVAIAIAFLTITLSLLSYTILSLFNQYSNTRKKEGQLLEKDAHYRRILDNMLEGVQIHDFNWRYIYVNTAVEIYSQCPKEELLGYTLMEKYPGIEQTEVFKAFEACMKDRVPKQLETEFVFPGGRRAFFEISVQPVPEGIFVLSFDKSEQHKIKHNLQESELKYRNVVDTIHESLLIEDNDGKLVYANSEFCKTFGFSADELGSLSIKDYTSEESYNEIVDRHNKRIQGLPVADEFIYKGRRKDGTEIWIEARVSLLVENGQVMGTQSLERDITERINAEEKIKKTGRMFAFLSAINQSIVHTASEGELLDAVSKIATGVGQFKLAYVGLLNDDGRLRITSMSGNANAAKNLAAMTLGMDEAAYASVPSIQVLRSGQYSYNNNVQNDIALAHLKKDYVQYGIQACIALPVFKFGKMIGLLSIHAGSSNFFDTEEIALLQEAVGDISFALENFENRRRHNEIEDLLLKSEKRFRGIIEKSSDFKTLTDKHGKLTYCNPSVLSAFGYTMEEFIGTEAMKFFHPDDVQDLVRKRNEILDKPGASYKFEYRLRHKNGEWIWCEGTVTNFLQEPAIQAMVNNFRNISEKKKSALEKETLIKQLTQNNHDLRQFAYITSHNLRGPIANLLGLTNLLDTLKVEDQMLATILTGIKTATVMFDETIRDLATVLTLRDNPSIQLETIALADVMNKVCELCDRSIIESDAHIATDFKAASNVSFNKAYLESIFINLLTNAIKYRNEERPLNIEVSTMADEEHVILRFADNGIGFDSELQKDKVFKLYQRFHVHKEGKGLGLFLIKSQLDALGGHIDVQSQPGAGSIFTIKFKKQ